MKDAPGSPSLRPDQQALLITGPIGAGKSVVAQEVTEIVAESGVASCAMVDLDHLAWMSPLPSSDPDGTRLMSDNLGAIASNLYDAGARRLVLARAITNAAQISAFVSVLRCSLDVVRLEASPETIEARLRSRDGGRALVEHLRETVALREAIVTAAGSAPVVLNEGDLRDVAQEVLAAVSWMTEER